MDINLNRNLLEEITIPNRPTFRASFVPVFILALLVLFIPYLRDKDSIHTTIVIFAIMLGPVVLARIVDRIIDHHVLIIDWCLTILIFAVGVPTSCACGLIGIIIVFLFQRFNSRTIYFCVWVVAGVTLFMLGIRLTFDGEISKRKKLAVAVEHKGFPDYFLALYLMGFMDKYKIVYGTNLKKYFGPYADMVGIGVDRKSLRSKAEAEKAIDQALKEGYRIIFFPEGTRMRLAQVDQILLPFKRGAFNKIFENEAPIQSIVVDSSLSYSAADKKFPFSPGEIKISISEIIETEGQNQEEIVDLIHSDMKAKIAQSPKMKAMIANQG